MESVDCLNAAGKALHVDELSWRTTLPVARMATLLLSLEFKVVVIAPQGRMYNPACPLPL